MKILLVNNFFYPRMVGGAEVSTLTLAEGLVSEGHQVQVLCLGDDVASIGRYHGMTIRTLRDKNLGRSPLSGRGGRIGRLVWHASSELLAPATNDLRATLTDFKPDILHSFNLGGLSTTVWRVAAASDVPIVHTLYGMLLVCFRGPMFRAGHDCIVPCSDCRALTSRRRVDSRLVTAVAGDSDAVLRRHIEHGYFSTTQIQVVINSGYRNRSVRIDSRPESGKLRVGFIGRFHPTKGLNVLLEAHQVLPDGGWELLIAGRGDLRLEKRVEALSVTSNVHSLGWQEPEVFFSQVDVLVVPSVWNDPLPRVVYEAFSFGVPVLGARIGGIPEMIEEGAVGWTFEPGDVRALASLIQMAIDDPQMVRSMRDGCLKKAKHYSADRFIQDYVRLYESVASDPRVRRHQSR